MTLLRPVLERGEDRSLSGMGPRKKRGNEYRQLFHWLEEFSTKENREIGQW